MKFYKSKSGNWEVEFTSNINRETTSTNESLGEMLSTMELWQDGDKAPTGIEWCVHDIEGDLVEHADIGLEFDGKSLEGYDGVFELPIEAIKLIRKSGYSVPRHFEE
jgi:hypothetical protein|tara:strand:+ start:5183 stop:5503 length:321 start_codon:yes stop_codon:yes gene_type:complete